MEPRRLDDIEHEYLEGTLSPEDRRAFRARMADSAELRERIAGMEAVGALLAEWETPEPSADFAEDVLERIRREAPGSDETSPTRPHGPSPAHRIWQIPRGVGLAASVLLVVSLGFNALWVLYREALLSTDPPNEPRSTSVRPTEIAWERPAPAAFYYYLDPREEEGPSDEEEGEIGP